MKTGRNDPCFCGSGKKYKKCCMGRAEADPLQDIKNDVQNLLDGRTFDSEEELKELINQYYQQKNSASVEEFHGFSPEQMHRFLHMPFESPELVTFQQVLPAPPQSRAALLLEMLVEEIGAEGSKMTAKGNLGRKFCQKASEVYFDHYPEPLYSGLPIRSEIDFKPLHTIRLTAQLAGLVRKYKGRLIPTKKCLKSFERNGVMELYPLLMQPYIRKFNWAYRDGYGEVFFLQQSFLFTLYLLCKYGKSRQPPAFYSDNSRALKRLEPGFQDWWQDLLEDGEVEAIAANLRAFLQTHLLPACRSQLAAIRNHEAIKQQVIGEGINAPVMENLSRYETHLDRKFERTLAMLIKLKELSGKR